jgi:hypothetical protein
LRVDTNDRKRSRGEDGVAEYGILCRRRQQRFVARHDAIAKVLTAPTRLRNLPRVTVVEEPPAPTAAQPRVRADVKEEVVEGEKVAH